MFVESRTARTQQWTPTRICCENYRFLVYSYVKVQIFTRSLWQFYISENRPGRVNETCWPLSCIADTEHHSCHLFLHWVITNVFQWYSVILRFARGCRSNWPSMSPYSKLEHYQQTYTDPKDLPISAKFWQIILVAILRNKLNANSIFYLVNCIIWCPDFL